MSDTPKKSFYLFTDMLDCLDMMDDKPIADLFRMIKAYHNETFDQLEDIDPVAMAIFPLFKNQFDRDQEKYEKTCNANRINGLKGGRPKKQQVNEETQITHSVNSETHLKPSEAKKPDTDTDTDTDKTKRAKRFAPPTLQELKNYIKEKSLNVGAETFINHYETNGWKVGKNKMVSWKHAAANWSKRNNEQNKDERESSEKVWSDSATGIRGKGKEVGLREGDFDGFPQFKNAVMLEVRRLDNER